MSAPSPGSLLARYVPVAVGLAAAALFVATVPSKPPTVQTGSAPAGADFVIPDAPIAAGGNLGNDTASAGGFTAGSSNGSGTRAGSSGSTGGSASPGTSGSAGGAGNPTPGAADRGADPGDPQPTAETDCSRNAVLDGPTCRPLPAFSGDNGGATARNVTRDKVNMVFYVPKRNEQVQAILAAAGTASFGQIQEAIELYEPYFNERFETYGRYVDIIAKEGPGDGADPATAQADANASVVELGSFFTTCSSCGPAFYDEVIRLGFPALTVITPYTETHYQERAPLFYGILPDFDYTSRHAAEYWCKRLEGRPAVHAGSADLQAQERKLGIIAIESEKNDHERFIRYVEECGGSVVGTTVYASDISTAQTQATNAIIQMRQAGATTVTCLCDPVAPVFFTSAATEQGYFPEWYISGLFAIDSYKGGRLYDQSQWANAFGVSVLSVEGGAETAPYGQAYFDAGGTDGELIQAVGGSPFSKMISAFSAIEAAGPNLTVQSFTNALLTLPPMGRPGGSLNSFGNNGPSPFTRIDNVMEVWWDPNRQGFDDRPGFYFYVDAGFRRVLGEWPTSDPVVFVDDGSEQP